MAGLALHAARSSGSCGRRSTGRVRPPGTVPMARIWICVLVMAVVLPGVVRSASALENTASGSVGSSVLDTTGATVTLNLLSTPVDPGNSSVTVSPTSVPADGTSMSTITVILRDALNQPVPGRSVSITSDRGAVDMIVQPTTSTDASGIAVGTIRSAEVGIATITVTDTMDSVDLVDRPQVVFTQGQVLDLVKAVNRKEAVSGDVVTYFLEVRNLTGSDVLKVSIDDVIPPNFRYVSGSTRLNGSAVPDPGGNRPLIFDVGTIAALADSNGNGVADPGEPGYVTLSYQLVVGSGARPGDFVNTAVAWDADPSLPISNSGEARVTVILDPLFELGTIIGKVFVDRDGNGWQEEGEEGLAGVTVVLDDGTNGVTDSFGRYHFAAVRPGHRLVKIDRRSLPNGVEVKGDETKVASVTPGLLAKLNFTVQRTEIEESIGRPAGLGLRMAAREEKEPLEVLGSVEMMTVLVNGVNAGLSTNDVALRVDDLAEVVTITGGRLEKPIYFQTGVRSEVAVSGWRLTVKGTDDEVIRTFAGEGPPPGSLGWNGITDQGELLDGGEIYRYAMEVWYTDGSYSSSGRKVFGVNRKSVLSLDISGAGFELGSASLREATKAVLSQAAQTLRKYPDEVIVIEGHTDATGSEALNMRLSEKRAQAAYRYLVEEEKMPGDRFVVKGCGEANPIASNNLPEGRDLNRRIEIKGQVLEVRRANLLDQVREDPEVKVNGGPVDVDLEGRFKTEVTGEDENSIQIRLSNSSGQMLEGSITVPALEILDPHGEQRLGYDETGGHYRVGNPGADGHWSQGEKALVYTLRGRTDPGNVVELDRRVLPVSEEGIFSAEITLGMRETDSFSLLVTNAAGFTRIANIHIYVTDREDKNRPVIVRDPIPNLSVSLPPEGVSLHNPLLSVPGATDPGNRVWIGGQEVKVHADGSFMGEVDLRSGENLIVFRVVDQEGYEGTIERRIVLSDEGLFLMAFADGKIGQIRGKGYLEGAGMEKEREFYQEGRVAYYLKGTIAGKYLITSAFDSGTGEFGDLFKDLDQGQKDRFFTNLDPDRQYPVYGDSSTTTYDAQSQGKFYLALTTEEFHLLVGNYSLNFSDTELSAYQRTLYGGKFAYQSVARTKYGEPDTTILLFGAQVRYSHIRDELRGTGGSLYYLSRRDISEGSDEVAIVIRDQNTGLVRARIPLRRDADYQIRYEEGRVLLSKPLASVVQDDLLIDDALLSGSPLSIQIDYEVEADELEKTSTGGRIRKQVGDSLSIGGTYVDDQLESGSYELTGFDAKLRLGTNSWISGEYASSAGSDSPVFVSEDGGLTFTETSTATSVEGSAWKAAARLDVGELFGSPEHFEIGGYIKRLEPGFQSNANFADEGTQKSGADFILSISPSDTLSGQYDRQESLDAASLAPGAEDRSQTGTVQWAHQRGRMKLTLEYRARESEDAAGNILEDSGIGAGRLDLTTSGRMSSYLEHQQSLTGPENDQTSLGTEYMVNEAMSLRATGTHGTMGDSAQAEANLNLGDSRLYLTETTVRDSAGNKNTTVLGTETSANPSSKVYTENRWESADDGTDRQISLLGVQKDYELGRGLKVLFSGEASEVESETDKLSRYALATGLTYRGTEGFEVSVRGEVRRERGSQERVQYLTANRFEVGLSPDYSLLGRYNYSITRDLDLDETEARFEERSIGLAYRPVEHDRFNLLARYTLISDQAPDSLDEMESMETETQVASVEWSLDLTPRLEWVEKDALKVREEKTGDRSPVKTHTSLSIHRLNYNFLGEFDLGIEYRMKHVDQADDQQSGWLTELMYRVNRHMRLGAGFNFTDFSDNEFSENDYSVRGVFVRIQGKY